MTAITIPENIRVEHVADSALSEGWDNPVPIPATREYGQRWIEAGESLILRVPSSVVKSESNYVINVRHPNFSLLGFGIPEPFRFDDRLK